MIEISHWNELKDIIHALLDLSPIQLVSSKIYRYSVEQFRYCKVILKNDKSIHIMITKNLRNLIETLELLIETSNLQMDLNPEARTSQKIVSYDISSHPPSLGLYSQLLHSIDDDKRVHSQLEAQLGDTLSSQPWIDDFNDENECFPYNDDDGDDNDNNEGDDDSGDNDNDEGGDNDG